MTPMDEHQSAAAPKGWSAELDAVLVEPRRLRVHYQPVVDLRRGAVRGYEAVARLAGMPAAAWRAAAARAGRPGVLEAQVLDAARVGRPLLPRARFLAVHLEPAALLSAPVAAVLRRPGRLDGLILELGTDPLHGDREEVDGVLASLRARGAAIAYAGADPAAPTRERATYVKLDVAVLARATPDEAERLAEAHAVRAERLGASLVVTGVETQGELDLVVGLGIGLAQGVALARPEAAMTELRRGVATRLRRRAAAPAATAPLAPLAERVPAVRAAPAEIAAAFAGAPRLEHVLCVDADGFPTGIVDRCGHERGTHPRPVLQVPTAAGLAEAARLAVARPPGTRFDPLVCVDPGGASEGIVPINRLLGALAR